MVSATQSTELAYASTASASNTPPFPEERGSKVASTSLSVFERFHQAAAQQMGGQTEPLATPRRHSGFSYLTGPRKPISIQPVIVPSVQSVTSRQDEAASPSLPSELQQDEEPDSPLFDPDSISPVRPEAPTRAPETDLTPYLKPEITLDPQENFAENPDAYPFLRGFVFWAYGKSSWAKLSELESYKEEIKRYFQQEIRLRDPNLKLSLETPQDWALAEKTLHEFDEPNLSKIMGRVVPLLQQKGYLKTPSIVERGQVRKTSTVVMVDCFKALWEITHSPEMLNKITELDLSALSLNGIPPSFSKLHFSRVERLSLANNTIMTLPGENFFSKYPSLTYLDCTACGLTNVTEGLFSVLPNLNEVNFKGNWLSSIPFLGITDQHLAKRVKIDLSNNTLITRVEPTTIEELLSARSVHTSLNLTETFLLPDVVTSTGYPNITLIMSPLADPGPEENSLPSDLGRGDGDLDDLEESKKPFKRGDFP